MSTLGKKPATERFYGYVAGLIRAGWPDLKQSIDAISADDVLLFAKGVAHFSPSAWNSIVTALRFITPHGKLLKRRAMTMRQFAGPGQSQFAALLAECDAAPRSQAGLVVRFLALTGLRISEANRLTWANMLDDCIEVPATITKNGKPRRIPLVAGLPGVLASLKALDSGPTILPQQGARKAIATACRKVGIERLTHHCFRHYYATKCIESGVDVPTVARWLGHLDGGALLSRTYFHLLDDHGRAMARKVRIPAL